LFEAADVHVDDLHARLAGRREIGARHEGMCRVSRGDHRRSSARGRGAIFRVTGSVQAFAFSLVSRPLSLVFLVLLLASFVLQARLSRVELAPAAQAEGEKDP